jgi:LPS export ABC transporter protein LptC
MDRKLHEHFPKLWMVGLVCLGWGMLTACQSSRDQPRSQQPSENLGGDLAFRTITLEQANEQGQRLWVVRSNRVTYDQAQKASQAETPNGELWQEGNVIYRFQAKRALIRQEGQQIILKDQIQLTDTRDGAVLRGNEAEWRPQQSLLVVRNQFTVAHPKIQGSARQGQVLTRSRQIELEGGVVATTADQTLKLRTERLTWLMAKQQIVGNSFTQVDRYQNQVATDRASGNQVLADQNTKTVVLKQNVQVQLQEPPLNIAGQALTWNVPAKTIRSADPIQVYHRVQKIQLNASQGRINVPQKIFYLMGTVQGSGERNQARLLSDRLTWFISAQEFLAEGNVFYRQQNPTFSSTGPKAKGKFRDEQVVLSGGNNSVVTEIIPQTRRN